MKTHKENVNAWRRRIVIAILIISFAGLVGRAINLQLNHKEFLQSQGNARHLRVVEIPAHRGKILDRNGYPLAISTPVDSVWANPREFKPHGKQFRRLVALLGLDGAQLRRELESRQDREFVFIKRQLEPSVAERAMDLGIQGVHLQREYRRYYPMGEVAAHVVGLTNVDDVGQEGIELAYNEHLKGTSGSKRVLRDRIGQIVEDVERIKAPKAGSDLRLSIDRGIQYLAYRRLLSAVKRNRAQAGSAVVLDIRSGEVLAMVNQPSYNPNNRSDRAGNRFRNRAVTDVFEPGSTAKPFTIAAALGSGRFEPDTVVNTAPGFLKVGKYTVHDIRNYGSIDLATIVKKSSNVGASMVALALPPKDLWQTLARFGFGTQTGSGYPGETEGVLSHFFEWSEAKHASLSYGYGFSVSAIQLARAYAAIGNDGKLPDVSFEALDETPESRQAISRRVAHQLRRMLESVVSAGGTGERARVDGYRVGGKTGTVRKVTPQGYSEDRYVAVFAGIAPMSSPRIAVVVVLDEPNAGAYYGGEVAAPAFAAITEGALRMLGVAPDDRSLPTRHAAVTTASASLVDRIQAVLARATIGSVDRTTESPQ